MARKKLNEEANTPKKGSMGKGGTKKSERLNMAMVEELRNYQKIRNSELKDIGLKCNLNPKKDSVQCKECRFYKDCKQSKLERKHICKEKHTSIAAKRKRNVDDKTAMLRAVSRSHEIFEDEIDQPEDAYEENP